MYIHPSPNAEKLNPLFGGDQRIAGEVRSLLAGNKPDRRELAAKLVSVVLNPGLRHSLAGRISAVAVTNPDVSHPVWGVTVYEDGSVTVRYRKEPYSLEESGATSFGNTIGLARPIIEEERPAPALFALIEEALS
jgi:hypothetical protein